MSLAVEVKTVKDTATPVLRAVSAAVSPNRLKPIVGRAVVNVLRKHLFAADSSKPNALGGARTHFYANAARGSHYDVLSDGVLVSINNVGIRQRFAGGPIKPKKAKFLTIPARAEAYGKRASEFNDLVVVFGRGGVPVALARAVQTTLKVTGAATALALGVNRFAGGSTTGGEILFWLRKEVQQPADPSVLPTRETIQGAINKSIDAAVKYAADNPKNGGNPA